MKVTLISDLHLEVGILTQSQMKSLKNQKSDVLILAGDIVSIKTLQKHKNFFDEVCSYFHHVVYVMGNHEFYGGKFNKSIVLLKDFASQYSNLHVLENSVVQLDDVAFLGSTLWTRLKNPIVAWDVENCMNDYRAITYDGSVYRKLLAKDTDLRHQQSVFWLEQTLKQHNKVVVVTHHCPSFKSMSEHYQYAGNVNYAYYNDLEYLMESNVVLWCHGHTHDKKDYVINTTRVLCNPRGYRGYEPQEVLWSPITVEI